MLEEIKSCKLCGTKPFEIDFGSSFEYGEKVFQIGNIGCGNSKCSTDVMITFETINVSTETVKKAAITAWNIINSHEN